MARNRHQPYGQEILGEDTKGVDWKIFGDTTGKYVFWDASTDTLYVVGTLSLDGTFNADNIALADSETLTFGTGLDVVLQWDGTNLIIAAAADDSLIEIGDSASTQKSFDLKWYGGQASGASYLYADASANLIYTVDVDLQIKDNDYLVIGTGAGAEGDVNITWDATNLVMATPAASAAWLIGAAAHVINTTLTGTFTVGVDDTGYDVKLFGATTGTYLLWDESENDLLLVGAVDFKINTNKFVVTGSTGIVTLANSATISNTAAGTMEYVAAIQKFTNDATHYWTATQSGTNGVTFASTSAGTAGFTFSQSTDFTAGIKINSTNITMAPDATAGIGLFNLTGTLATNPGAAVIAHTVSLTHSAGAGDCDDLIATYGKVNIIGAGDSGVTAVGIAARAYQGANTVNAVAKEVYGTQSWAKHMGTGSCNAMSGLSAALLLEDGSAFSAVNSINAGHFHVYTTGGTANGAVTSGNFDCVMMEVYPTVTGLQSVLNMAIETAATVGAWFDLNGGADVTNFFNISAASSCVVVAAGTTMHHDPNDVTSDGHLIIKIGAVQYDIPFYDHA